VESKVEPKHYFAALIAIVMVVAIAVLSKTTPPTQPVIDAEHYYDTETYQIHKKPAVVDVDDLSFEYVFSLYRDIKGSDDQFYWRKNWYTTNLLEEQMGNGLLYRYIVSFKIVDEEVSKLFNNKEQAETFAQMVSGKVTEYTTSDNS
jgi:hypothetical protein